MNKENFLAKLQNPTPEELNRIIENKGKKPKKIKILLFFDENDKIIK